MPTKITNQPIKAEQVIAFQLKISVIDLNFKCGNNKHHFIDKSAGVNHVMAYSATGRRLFFNQMKPVVPAITEAIRIAIFALLTSSG